jgi:hypothetical protein
VTCSVAGSYVLVLIGVWSVPACPPGGPQGQARPPTPLEASYAAWYTQVVLPKPTLSASPTIAITGLDTFLTIGGPTTVTWSGTALGMPVDINVTSTYDIDWDEPKPDASKPNGAAKITGTTSQGGPWPNGDLRHQYIERGSATIQVTQRWTAHWSVGSESGVLADRLHTTSSLMVPIQEIQAVVTG